MRRCRHGRLAGSSVRLRASEPDDLADRAGHLVATGCPAVVRIAGGCQDAVTQVIVEQADRHLRQGAGGRADLEHHVGAPGVGFDHLLQAADLAFDLAQPPEVVLLAGGITTLRARGTGSGRRAALAGQLAIGAGGDGRHRPLPLPAGLRSSPGASTSRSRRYSSVSISPRARRSSRMRRASSARRPSPWFWGPGRRVAVVIRAYTAQISRPQNAIMPTHIKATSQKGQPPPFQNIITTISLRAR